MPFDKLPAIEGSCACLTCGAGARSDLDMGRPILVGFGSAGYSRDGVSLYDEQELSGDWDKAPTVQTVEDQAAADPDHDWRIYFYAPLYSAEYQRHGDGMWALIKKDEGFA